MPRSSSSSATGRRTTTNKIININLEKKFLKKCLKTKSQKWILKRKSIFVKDEKRGKRKCHGKFSRTKTKNFWGAQVSKRLKIFPPFHTNSSTKSFFGIYLLISLLLMTNCKIVRAAEDTTLYDSGALEIETVTIPDFSSEIFTTQEIVLTVVLAQKEALKSEEEKTKINFSTKILSNEDDDSPDSDSEVQAQVPVEGGRGYSKPNKFRRKLSRMNRNRKQDDDKDEDSDVTGDKPSTSVTSNFQTSTSTKQRNKGSTDRTFNELLPGGEVSDFKPFKNVINKTLIVRDRIQKGVIFIPTPTISKKTYTIGFILLVCVAVAISINFINLHSDFQDLKDFYRGYMGRKLLILEGRLTSRTFLLQLKESNSRKEDTSHMETSLTSLHDCHSDKVYLMGNGHAPVCLFEPEIESAKTVYAASAGNRHRPYPEVSVISCSNEQLATDTSRRLTTSTTSSRPTSATQTSEHFYSNSLHTGHRRATPSTTTTTLTTLPIREDNNRQLNGNGSAMTNGSSSNNNNNNAHNNSNHKNVKLTSDQVKVFLGPVPNVSIIALQQKLCDPFTAIETSHYELETIQAKPDTTRAAHQAADRIVQDRTHYLQQHLPLLANDYIEDHDPEWRDLDYSSDVGPPPKNFCQFIVQYDWNVFTTDRLNNSDVVRRRNLLRQFRKWKIRKRKLWTIVVTERAKKEMAEQEKRESRGRT